MEVSCTVHVSCQRYFAVIQDSIVQAIDQGNNPRITNNALRQGLQYRQTLRNKQTARCKITDFKQDRLLRIEFKTEGMLSIMAYQLKPQGDMKRRLRQIEKMAQKAQ